MDFKKYIHIMRVGQQEVEGLLNGTCYIFPKIDGTNASIYFDPDSKTICTGSRTRKITPEKDNAHFATWTVSDNEQSKLLRQFVTDNPTYIVYGEWLGTNKFLGHIKDYDKDARNALWIFDIFDRANLRYLTYEEMVDVLTKADLVQWMIPLLAKVDNPTEDELAEIAQINKFLLGDDVEHAGEGIVIHNYDFHDEFGNYQVAKLVLDEYKQRKYRKHHAELDDGVIESEIVEEYLTDAELDKNKEKVVVKFELDEFDITKKNCIGMFFSLCYRDTILSEIGDIVKRFKDPTINFRTLKRAAEQKGRKYLGLE